jgi:hypothetical protein
MADASPGREGGDGGEKQSGADSQTEGAPARIPVFSEHAPERARSERATFAFASVLPIETRLAMFFKFATQKTRICSWLCAC